MQHPAILGPVVHREKYANVSRSPATNCVKSTDTVDLIARESKNRTGGQLIVDQLAVHGVTHVFCVPGESYLPVLDALHDSPINVTVCRHEGGAAMMAEAAGKLTRRPGIVFVTRGPGATNAAAGIHVASQDSTPLIMFVGQVSRDAIGREGFQEMNYTAVFGSIAKLVIEIADARRIPELLSRAFHVAMQVDLGRW